MVWNAIGIARGSNGDDEQIDEMLEKAYRKGYKKAMEEMHEGYGERGGLFRRRTRRLWYA